MAIQELTQHQMRHAELRVSAAKKIPSLGLELRVCDPQGEPAARLFTYLAELEPLVAERAGKGPLTMFAGLPDKARQNAVNKLGGSREAGDQAVLAYWDMLVGAADLFARASSRKNATDAHVIRVSPSSDEGIMLFFGKDFDEVDLYKYSIAMNLARRDLDLRRYVYNIRVGYGSVQEEYQLDLEAFSRVLRHQGIAVACNNLVSKPRIVLPHSKGFVREVIRRLEDSELSFYYLLPQSFKGRGDGLAEVETPFDTNLTRLGTRNASRGAFIEIKLRANPDDARDLLKCINDRPEEGMKGTRKGFAEVYSGLFGMRGFNTFMGKAQTNRVLTAVAHGVYEFAAERACRALPVDGCYLRYWIDVSPNDENVRLIEKAIATKLDEQLRSGRSFKPTVTAIGTGGVWTNELRARFIMRALGQEGTHFSALDRIDFLINFIENIAQPIQDRIIDESGTGGNGKPLVSSEDRRYLNELRYLCGTRRTIRDTEDLVWTLRMDETLPEEMRARRQLIEDWLFRFANEHFERIFRDLTRTIDRMKRNRDGSETAPI